VIDQLYIVDLASLGYIEGGAGFQSLVPAG